MAHPRRSSPAGLSELALASVTFVAFAALALRHVGESVFLADQADQLQLFEQLLRGEPSGLLGPMASGPPPPVRSTGPLGAVLFGLPVAFGLGVDAVHALTSIVLVATTAGAFAALLPISRPFAWAWLVMLLANPIVWWNAGLLWVNTLMLPAGNVLLASMALALRAPSMVRLLSMALVVLFALQVSLVAITALPPLAVVAALAWRAARARPLQPTAAIVLACLTLLAAGPYLIGDGMNGFANTRAIASRRDAGADAPPATANAEAVVRTVVDPAWMMRPEQGNNWLNVAGAGALVAASLLVGGWHLRRSAHGPPAAAGGDDQQHHASRVMLGLVLTAVVAVAGQAAFFVIERRALLSYHYIAMLLPLYALPVAALLAWIAAAAPRRVALVATVVLAAGCATVLVWRGPLWADRYFQSTDWTFTRISRAVGTLCEGGGARVHEGPGFASLMPRHDGVLTYLMTRGFVDCRHDEASDRLIAATVERNYDRVRRDGDASYELVEVADPGIALYRRQPAAIGGGLSSGPQ